MVETMEGTEVVVPGLVCRLHHPSGLLIEDREWSYPGRLAEPTGTLPGCYRTGGDEGRCIFRGAVRSAARELVGCRTTASGGGI